MSTQNALANSVNYSRFAQRVRRRYEAQLPLLAVGEVDPAVLTSSYQVLLTQLKDTGAALRCLRHLVMERLMVLDCEQGAPLELVIRSVTQLAEFALDVACRAAFAQLDDLYGAPQVPDSTKASYAIPPQRAQLWVVGMGKLGARELNVSSDIDLIYIYDHDGETAGNDQGRNSLSNQEYFSKAVKIIYALIGDTTEHGFVFRVDLALRPNGNSGPPAVSLDALENYFQSQGREWERFAWLKSRVVAPRHCIEEHSPLPLRSVVLPFVFRKYLDYNVFEALRVLHRQIRSQASKRSAGHPERANDVKLSRGGIREIEFTVQLLQVVRGGQYPELRTRPTLDALQRLTRAGLMPQTTAEALAHAYVFLRRVEHRIQYLDDQQTHVLPIQDEDLNWIAQTMGYALVAPFLAELDRHRELVAQEFDILLGYGASGDAAPKANACKHCNSAHPSPDDFATLLASLPVDFQSKVKTYQNNHRVLALRDESRVRLIRLVQRTGEWLSAQSITLEAAERWVDWMEPLLRREGYLAMLVERPSLHQRLLRLLGAAKWPARYMLQHPGVIDELADANMLTARFSAIDLERELEDRRASLQATAEDDDETLLNLLRRAHHAEVFRTLARDVEACISVEQVADDLSALADCLLKVTVRWCWQRLKQAHRVDPQFGIVAYGKLGGKELGYGSDLDIVFVYEDDDERAPEAYSAFVRKLINWLTVKTSEGDLFEIDTALRPNGNSGMLVTTFQAYSNYQTQRGSNTAWTWEHQAMTRTRFVLGRDDLHARFDAVRSTVMTAQRDTLALKAEISDMRDKLRKARPVQPGKFDVKHSPGGMVDAEFALQYLILAHAANHPELIPNMGNTQLLRIAESVGLLPNGMGEAAANAYRALRRVQHHARLNETSTQIELKELQPQRDAIVALWQHLFH